VLRGSIAGESVDLIYPDPPINSKREYHLLFMTPTAPTVSDFPDAAHAVIAQSQRLT
jgi:hypothetical protein